MSFLSVSGRERWKGRGSVGTVVLADDHSTMEGLGETLLALKDSLALVSVCLHVHVQTCMCMYRPVRRTVTPSNPNSMK